MNSSTNGIPNSNGLLFLFHFTFTLFNLWVRWLHTNNNFLPTNNNFSLKSITNGGNLYERSGNLYEGSGTFKALRNKRFLSAPTGNRTGASQVEGQRVSLRLRRQAYQKWSKSRWILLSKKNSSCPNRFSLLFYMIAS